MRDDLKTYPTFLKQLENALDVFVTYQERIFVRKPIELILLGKKIYFADKHGTFANKCETLANKRETFRIYTFKKGDVSQISVSFFVIDVVWSQLKFKYKLFWFYQNRKP